MNDKRVFDVRRMPMSRAEAEERSFRKLLVAVRRINRRFENCQHTRSERVIEPACEVRGRAIEGMSYGRCKDCHTMLEVVSV